MNYNKQLSVENEKKLLTVCEQLPDFVRLYFNAMSMRTTVLTRLKYASDYIMFFRYLLECNPLFKDFESAKDIPLEYMDKITIDDLEFYQAWLGREHTSTEKGKTTEPGNDRVTVKRKLSALRSLYNYFCARGKLANNPAILINMPKTKEKEIIRMDPAEVANLLDNVEFGTNLTKREALVHEKTGTRDLAIVTLLLGTGIRVSECVGIDIDDFNWDETSVLVHRKGGKQERIYFGEEVSDALLAYKSEREHIEPDAGSENAFFISLNNTRITTRSVERLVKKYAQTITTKHITPHKCRSTYGTNLYQETGDVLLVSKQLGHSSPTVTAQHYTATLENQKISIRDVVKLRNDT